LFFRMIHPFVIFHVYEALFYWILVAEIGGKTDEKTAIYKYTTLHHKNRDDFSVAS
jgi:hypothetical protein